MRYFLRAIVVSALMRIGYVLLAIRINAQADAAESR